MSVRQLVDPSHIESKLRDIWEELAKENKMRASLFNLIVYNQLGTRTDYIQHIIERVIEKFPCRILFIASDPEATHSYLKAAVSVVLAQGKESAVACDHIDIGATKETLAQVPFLILPHILPDLPITLLWTEDPSQENPLFEPLAKLATRIIFDSESAGKLSQFAQTLLHLNKQGKAIADLSWAHIHGWRSLLASTFDSEERVKELQAMSSVRIVYNDRQSPFFCHRNIQALYLSTWLQTRLGWQKKKIDITTEAWENLGSGTILEIRISSTEGHTMIARRIPEQPHRVNVEIASAERCDLPYQFLLGETASGQSLVQEITAPSTSQHFIEMLCSLNGI
ncbi:MAG: hypothetical protein RL235_307 [Chlamydiota bacterium]|jgi:glucose-6-phosphate dehydrogenase assembly protein OpcA